MSPAYGYVKNKGQLKLRLSRIEGQVRGISKMVEDDRYCIDILTQIGAVEAALDKTALSLLHDHTAHCLTKEDGKSSQAKADEVVQAVGRLLAT